MFKINSVRIALAALFFAACLTLGADKAFAQAQGSTGQITGAVRDTNGAAIPGAKIKATNTQTGLEQTATSNGDGVYRIVLLPPGDYNITAEADRFTKTEIKSVQVVIGQVTDANIALGVGSVQEAIVVTADAIQTTVSQPDAIINETAINNLPINGRRFQDFATLTPTAQVDTSRGQISLSGQRGIYGTNINIDGLDYNQPFFGGIRGGERSNNAFTIPQESIKEFQVISSGYSAEFGRSTGGVITVVTKSGTNEFHGTGFYLNRHRELATTNAFGQSAAPTQQQFGGSIGGPIFKDKTFFFGSYEQQENTNPRLVLFDRLVNFTPTAAQQEAFDFFKGLEMPFDQTNDAIAFLGRFDHQFNEKNRFNARYSQSSSEALNANSVGNQLFPSTTSALSNNGTEKDRTYTVVGQLSSFFSSNLVNELRAQYTREVRPRLANALAPNISSAVGNTGTVSFLPTTQFDWRTQVFNNLTWIKGNHSFKFGGEYNHTFADQTFAFNQFGLFNIIGNDTGAILSLLSRTPGTPTDNRFDATSSSVQFRRQIGNGRLAFDGDTIAFYAQDSWRIRPNFTLNYGLRYEAQFNPTPDVSNTALTNLVQNASFPIGYQVDPSFIPNNTKQFAPRLGFAWDPGKNGRTVIRGFGGIYYASTPGLLFAGPLSNFRIPAGDLSIQLPLAVPAGNPMASCNTVYCQLNLIGVNLNNFTLDTLPTITAEQVQGVAAALGLSNFSPFTGAQPITWSRNYENPRSYQFGVGVERELGNGLTVGADYSQINTVHLQRNREVNVPAPIIRATDPAQRPFFGITGLGALPRPVTSLGSVQVRESSARSVFQSAVFRAQFRRKWGQFNTFYTLSRSLSDDDNERDSGGVGYENGFNLIPEFNYSRLDRRHQFVANPVFFLPYNFEVSSAVRLLSGLPIDVRAGSDLNLDTVNNDRPYSAPGVPFKRNAFRNRAVYNVDFRLQKGFNFTERARLTLSAEMFNIFNFDNIQYAGSIGNLCVGNPVPADCGFGTTGLNPQFLQLRNPDGSFILTNNPGVPFQAQFGARFQF